MATLGKNERLKSRKAIEELFDKGKRFSVRPLNVVYIFTQSKKEEGQQRFPLRMGVGVSSRSVRKAVSRNLIKRRLREAFRAEKKMLEEKLKMKGIGIDVFFLYNEKEVADYSTISQLIKKALDKLTQLTDERSIAHT